MQASHTQFLLLSQTATQKENYDLILELAEKYLSQSEIAVFKLGLSLRIYSARVEMFSQMAVNKNVSSYGCNNVVNIGGTFTCSLENIDRLLEQVSSLSYFILCNLFIDIIHIYIIVFVFQDTWETVDTYDVDHRYLNTPESDKIMILYGQIGTPTFTDFHEKLKNVAETKGINYILRHYVKVTEIRYRYYIYY